MKRGKYTILVLVITVSIIVFLLLNLLLIGVNPVCFRLEYLDGRGGRSGCLAEYHTEIPFTTSIDGFGGRGRVVN